MHDQSGEPPHRIGAGAAETRKDDSISQIISEFSDIFAFARSRWASYASEVHPDMKGTGVMVLQLVLKKGPVTATGISQMLDLDKAVVSRQITKLRELGLVAAEPAPDDRRVVLLTPTPEAISLFERIREQWAHSYHERFAHWSADDLERLREGLHRFNAGHEFNVEGPAGRCAREEREERGDRAESGLAGGPERGDRAESGLARGPERGERSLRPE